MAEYNPGHKAVLDELLLAHPMVRAGKMFGFPAYYASKKLCICIYGKGVGVKLPEQSASKLLMTDSNVVPFQPLGKPKMREWIQINLADSKDYDRYVDVFEESIRFLLEQQGLAAYDD